MNKNYKKKFGEKLAELLEERKLKQSELAKKIGVSRQVISTYVRGLAQPHFEHLVSIANFFDITVDELFLGKPENKPMRDLLGLSEEAIENIKEIKEIVITIDNGVRYPLIFLLDKILSDRKLSFLLRDLLKFQQGINNPSAVKALLEPGINAAKDYTKWRLLNLMADYYWSIIKSLIEEEAQNSHIRAEEIAKSLDKDDE